MEAEGLAHTPAVSMNAKRLGLRQPFHLRGARAAAAFARFNPCSIRS